MRRGRAYPLAYRLCRVAEGRADAAVSFARAWDWDIAAATLVAREAGLLATNLAGEPLGFNRPDPRNVGLIVAPQPLHAEIRGRITPSEPRAR